MTVTHRKRSTALIASEAGQKFHCDGCQANLTDIVRISCAECAEFDLCVTCFSKGIEIGTHKSSHAYVVASKHTFPIFTADWSADEELLLIDGLMQFGMGNWEEVSLYLGTRTKQECEDHYYDVYINSEKWPLPEVSRVFGPTVTKVETNEKTKTTSKSSKPLSSQPTNHEVMGYMPGRQEFEVEYENDAEQLIKDLYFGEEDSAEETALKTVIMEIYNNKLERREERKRFLLERNLLDYSKNMAVERKRAPEDRDMLNKTKVFAKVMNTQEYKMFTDGLLYENAYKKRILQLQEWRRNGITTIAEGNQYELEKIQRQSKARSGTPRDCIQNLEKLHKMAIKHLQKVSGADSLSNAKTSGKKPIPLDVKNASGAQLLTPNELELCERLRILPRPYIATKQALISEYIRLGKLTRQNAHKVLQNVSQDKVDAIYEFFIQAGWVV